MTCAKCIHDPFSQICHSPSVKISIKGITVGILVAPHEESYSIQWSDCFAFYIVPELIHFSFKS